MSSPVNKSTNANNVDECGVVTNNTKQIFQIVNFVVICEIIGVFGTGTNIINIMCFVKQGLRDPVNISLLGLAASDLLSLVTMIWVSISVNPWISELDITFDFTQTTYLTGGIPHVGFTRVTCWITAFIALERCLCVALPVKIKWMLTTNRAIIIIITIYIINFFGYLAPSYYYTRFAVKQHPRKPNTTWLGVIFTEDRVMVERYSFIINNCFLPFTAFTVICASTVILVVKLKTQSNWRKRSTAPGKSDSISSRDQSVSRMVVVISIMFIICYALVCFVFIFTVAVPKFCSDGQFANLYSILYSFASVLESINASFNIFTYYKVSSRYRQTFIQTFIGRCGRNKAS